MNESLLERIKTVLADADLEGFIRYGDGRRDEYGGEAKEILRRMNDDMSAYRLGELIQEVFVEWCHPDGLNGEPSMGECVAAAEKILKNEN